MYFCLKTLFCPTDFGLFFIGLVTYFRVQRKKILMITSGSPKILKNFIEIIILMATFCFFACSFFWLDWFRPIFYRLIGPHISSHIAEKLVYVCLCFEGEGYLTFHKLMVVLFFFRLKRCLARRFWFFLPLVTLSSDTYFTFYCFGMFLFQN